MQLLLALLAALFAANDPATTRTSGGVADTTITVHTYGVELSFDPDEITVQAGSTVRIRYVNESTTFAHNLVLVRTDEDIDVLGPAALDAHDTGYIPEQHKDRILAHSPLANPGDTVEFTFTAPPAGEYPFVCLVDGHYNVMVGTLRTRE